MRRPIVIVLACMTIGCMGLVVRDKDSTAARVGKVSTRIFLGLITINWSEGYMQPYIAEGDRQDAEARSNEQLEAARTREELLLLLGMDYECVPLDATRETCEWHFPAGGRVIPEQSRSTISGTQVTTRTQPAQVVRGIGYRVTCILPTDGSAREPESCRLSRE